MMRAPVHAPGTWCGEVLVASVVTAKSRCHRARRCRAEFRIVLVDMIPLSGFPEPEARHETLQASVRWYTRSGTGDLWPEDSGFESAD